MPPGECFPWVLEHYFFHAKMQAPASFPCKPVAWVEGGLALGPAFSSAQQEQRFVCLQGTHPPQAAVLGCFHSGALSWRELCYTRPLHRCIAPGQIWDFALHFSDCRLKSFLFPFFPPPPLPSRPRKRHRQLV